MNRLTCAVVLLCATVAPNAYSQWTIQDAHTTADLRGIHAIGNGVAWASGTEGTVLRTTNDGKDWQRCTTPPDAGHLDFRGIQAFDASTAIVMSIGKGPLSRLYKTDDGCRTWKLVFTNPDPQGFWDAVRTIGPKMAWILGDPIPSRRPDRKPQFVIYVSEDGGQTFSRHGYPSLEAEPATSGVFAASNSSLVALGSEDIHSWCWFGAGGIAGPRVFRGGYYSDLVMPDGSSPITEIRWESATLPLTSGASAGVFSVAVKGAETNKDRDWIFHAHLIAVGGDYLRAEASTGTAAFSTDGGQHWTAAQNPPHGFRSAVAYDATTRTWITVGPNGTDISTDDGRNWHPLGPGTAPDGKPDPPDADQHWNALSLPFVVGPHGRIGKLNPQALSAKQ